MKRFAPLLFLLAACPRTSPGVPSPSPQSCRGTSTPKGCIRPIIEEIGGPQGVYLEGAGLELLHFAAVDPHARGVFPPVPGTQLAPTAVCRDQQQPLITVTGCTAVPEIPGARGVVTCQVDVQNSAGICNGRRDKGPTHHRGVTIVRGFWDSTGAWRDDPKVVTLSCDARNNAPDTQYEPADGAITKCARTWRLDPSAFGDGFLACIRMVRADYCGDGVPHTFPNTDVHVLTPRDPETARDHFCRDPYCHEASWSKDGAVCISRPRWNGTGMGFESCAQRFTQVGGQYCRANPNDGIVFSRSQQYVCGQLDPIACGPSVDPMCAVLDPGRAAAPAPERR